MFMVTAPDGRHAEVWCGGVGWGNHVGVLFMLWVMCNSIRSLRVPKTSISLRRFAHGVHFRPTLFRAPSKHACNIGGVTKPRVSLTFARFRTSNVRLKKKNCQPPWYGPRLLAFHICLLFPHLVSQVPCKHHANQHPLQRLRLHLATARAG